MGDGRFELTLCGVVSLKCPLGRDVTPRLRKTRALLAYLAMSDERPIERAALERLLWGDRMPRQQRDSLKQSLSEIRRAFADAPVQPLCTDGGPVRLALDGIRVDALEGPPSTAPPLLEGIAIREPAFDAWLTQARAALAPPSPPALHSDCQTPLTRRFRIDILPPRADGETSSRVVALVLDGISRVLDHTGLFCTADRRHISSDKDAGSPADMVLTTTALITGDGPMVSLAVRRTDNGETIWSTTETLGGPMIDAAQVFRMAAHCVEQISHGIMQSWADAPARHDPVLSAFAAIRHISRLSPKDIDAADRALAQASDMLGISTLYAWRAYLTTYQLEKGIQRDELDDRAREFSARALELDRSNPLSRALVAHAHSFVLRDHDRAREILSPVRGLVGQNAILADTVGLVHFYAGRFDEARAHARLACALGRWSPLRYAFTTLLSTSEMMLGDFDSAIATGQRALAQHPLGLTFQYEPTLRTLAASCALGNRPAEGRMVLAQLDRQTGQTLRDAMQEVPATVYPNPEVFKTVQRGIETLYA